MARNYSHRSRANKDKDFNDRYDNNTQKRRVNDFAVYEFEPKKERWRELISYFRMYPDMFLEFLTDGEPGVDLYFFQRVYLRIMLRYANVFITATRGTSKSYLQNLAFFLRCILYPGSKLFIVAPTKTQAASITQEKLDEIVRHFPILKGEIKSYIKNRDSTYVEFYNGSYYKVLTMSNATRGSRSHGGCIEEICDKEFKPEILNAVILPMMSNDRFVPGLKKVDPLEKLHKSQLYITTASERQHFAFEKAQEIYQQMINEKNAFFIGNGWELPCMHDLLGEDYVLSIKDSPTYSTMDWLKEYESVYVGSSTDSLVSVDHLQKAKRVKVAEWEVDENDKDGFYVLSYDVSRGSGSDNALSCLIVLKCNPKNDGGYKIQIVNIFSMEGTHTTYQAKFLKQKVQEFNASVLVIDANGLGSGVVDQLVLDLKDGYPPYKIINEDKDWREFYSDESIPMVYALKSNSKESKNSDMINHFYKMLNNRNIDFLVTPEEGLVEYCKSHKIKLSELDSEMRVQIEMPYLYNNLLQDELLNLQYQQTGNKTAIVKEVSRSIPKDKAMALMYGVWYIYTKELQNRKSKSKPKGNLKDCWFF